MKIALPMAQGSLCLHFGHCDAFAVYDVDTKNKKILNSGLLDAPPHQPGLFPVWLGEQGVNLVIAGGMGGRAIDLFSQAGIQVIVGAPSSPTEEVVNAYLAGTLTTSGNVCDH